jgi:hypothetical protein
MMADITFGQAVVVGVVSGGFPAIVSAVAAIVISRLNRAESQDIQRKVVEANAETQIKVDGGLQSLVARVESLAVEKGTGLGQAITASQVKEIVDASAAKVIDAAVKNGTPK